MHMSRRQAAFQLAERCSAIPVNINKPPIETTALGQAVLTRACWGGVGVSIEHDYYGCKGIASSGIVCAAEDDEVKE